MQSSNMIKTPVSLLQEYAQSRKMNLPDYIEGQDLGLFTCVVSVGRICALGKGVTKKAAKHDSALSALKVLEAKRNGNALLEPTDVPKRSMLNVRFSADDVSSERSPSLSPPLNLKSRGGRVDFISYLNEFASRKGLEYPVYKDEGLKPWNLQFMAVCEFLKYKTTGYGANKKIAKRSAAEEMCKIIKNDPTLKEIQKRKRSVSSLSEETANVVRLYQNLNIRSQQPLPERKEAEENESIISAEDIEDKASVSSCEDNDLNAIIDKLSANLRTAAKSDFEFIHFCDEPKVTMSLVITGTTFTVMGRGDTIEEAKIEALRLSLVYFKHGYRLRLQ